MKRILVITYWSYREPLIQNYTLPYVRMMLQNLEEGSRVILLTMEKPEQRFEKNEEEELRETLLEEGIEWSPGCYDRFGLLAAFRWGRVILKWVWEGMRGGFDGVHAWGTPAGGPAYWIARWSGTPFVIDSFEPHAESMVEAGQWRKDGMAHRAFFFFEKLQARRADAVIAVSPTMEGYSWSRYRALHPFFYVKPACVNPKALDENAERYRDELSHDTSGKLIGVYAGKFGGIYLEEETFDMIRAAYDEWGESFLMILLTDHPPSKIASWMEQKGIPSHVVLQKWVEPDRIPAYLARSDLALNPVRPLPSKRHCTSIKDGEYWAMGLPVMIPEGIGEDSRIIQERDIGVVLDRKLEKDSIRKGIREMRGLLEEEDPAHLRERIRRTAFEERGFEKAEEVYERVYGSIPSKRPFTILLIAYYRHDDPVFQSALLDYFKGLAPKTEQRFLLITFGDPLDPGEREALEQEWVGEGIYWEHLHSKERDLKSLQKGMDFIKGVRKGKRMARYYQADLVYSEGFPSAIIGHHVAKGASIPHAVHTFEPHADYMVEGGIWGSKSWEYRITKRYEERIGQEADLLITGTEGMKKGLEAKRKKGQILRIPSCVDLSFFTFSMEGREEVRKRYGIPADALVVTYLGKLGGMYCDEELFELFGTIRDEFSENAPYFMILTGMDKGEVYGIAERCRVDLDRIIVERLSREEVPTHLSAADVAISGVRPIPSKAYCSPIKHGEYWACGLPLLIFRGVSEDDALVEREACGIVIEQEDEEAYKKAASDLSELLRMDPQTLRERCRRVAEQERSLAKARDRLRDMLPSVAVEKKTEARNG